MTYNQEKQFKDHLFSGDLLEEAVSWIQNNLSPEDVFTEKQLSEWANGMKADHIFSEKELAEWAENNGFVKE